MSNKKLSKNNKSSPHHESCAAQCENEFSSAGSIIIVSFFSLLPFVFTSQLFDPVQIPQLLVAFLLCFIAFVVLAFKQYKDLLNIEVIDLFWFGYASFTAISLLFARDLSIGIFEFSKILLLYLLFKLFQFFLTKHQSLLSVLGVAISLNCIFQCCLAIAQMHFGLKLYGANAGFLGTMTHANVFSECILFSVPFVVVSVLGTKWPWRMVPSIALLLCLTLLVTAKTRSAWVSIGVAIVIIAIYLYKNKSLSSLKSGLIKYRKQIIISSVILVVLLTLLIITDWRDISGHIISLSSLDSSRRVYIWLKTVPIVKDHFLFGVGPGNWRFYMPVVNHIAFQRVHNDYLWILSESGIFALLSYLGIFGLTLFTITKNLRNLKGKGLLVNYCMLFGCIVYLSDSLFAFPKERPYLLVLVALLQAVVFSGTPVKIIRKVKVVHFASIAIVLSGISLFFCWNRLQGELLTKIVMQDSRLDPATKLGLIGKIKPIFYAVDPFSNPVKNIEGAVWIDMGDYTKAKQCFLDAYRIAPLNPDLLINLGSINEITANRQDARKYYNEAVAIDPSNSQAHLNLAVVEYKDGNRERATELVKRIDPNGLFNQQGLLTQYSILQSSLHLNLSGSKSSKSSD